RSLQRRHRLRNNGHSQPGANQADDGLQLSGFLDDSRRNLRSPASRQNQIVESGTQRARERKERFLMERAQSYPAFLGQGAPVGNGQYQALLMNANGVEIAVLERRIAEA